MARGVGGDNSREAIIFNNFVKAGGRLFEGGDYLNISVKGGRLFKGGNSIIRGNTPCVKFVSY